jgi:DNA-binding CsgD family transcriptional regulator
MLLEARESVLELAQPDSKSSGEPPNFGRVRPHPLASQPEFQTMFRHFARGAAVMQKAVGTGVSSEGFLLLDATMNPIFVNHAAAKILLYPLKVEAQKRLNGFLASKVRGTLLSGQSAGLPGLVAKFQSGKRLYLCRAFRVNAVAEGDSQPSVAVLLERGSAGSISLVQVSERFHLTTREQEVLQCLSEGGLTTKEIAARIGISPNTVKAFLRMIMLKMGVSTRSGILGKAITTKL